MTAVLRNYQEWCEALLRGDGAEPFVTPHMFDERSSVLFDTVAVYLAYDESLLEIERLPIALDDDGTMRITPGAPELRVATKWRDADGFDDHLPERLIGA